MISIGEKVTINCRCKDCREFARMSKSFGICRKCDMTVEENGFCSDGEKKEGFYISKNFVESEIEKIKQLHQVPSEYTNGDELNIRDNSKEKDAFERGLDVALAIVNSTDAINFDLEKKLMCLNCEHALEE